MKTKELKSTLLVQIPQVSLRLTGISEHWQPSFTFRQQNGKKKKNTSLGNLITSKQRRNASRDSSNETAWLPSSEPHGWQVPITPHPSAPYTTPKQLLKCCTPKYELRIIKYLRRWRAEAKATGKKSTLQETKLSKLQIILEMKITHGITGQRVALRGDWNLEHLKK